MPLRYPVVLSTFLMLGLAPVAAAQLDPGPYLKWDQCVGGGGAVNKDFACDTDAGYDELVLSYVSPVDLPQVVGIQARITLVHQDFIGIVDPFGQPPPVYPPLSPWWQFQSGGCRAGQVTALADFTAEPFASTPQCHDAWGPGVLPIVQVTYPYAGSDGREALQVAAAVPEGEAAPRLAGNEYYALRLRIRRIGTTGAGACDGCCVKTVLAVDQITLVQPAGVGDLTLTPSNFDSVVSWQFTNAACEIIPTARRSWGQIKSLFR